MTTHTDLMTAVPRGRARRLAALTVATGLLVLGATPMARAASPRSGRPAAGAGTTTFLGRTLDIWGFSTSPTSGPSAPGPVLVVPQGVTVDVTLHNGVAGQQMSLAFPGQRHVAVGSAVGDDVTGVVTGDTRTYRFTASRPGTFVYEAGHTGNGTRQGAMGLPGAVLVRPADGTAFGAGAGMPDASYQDEAVLALSEIDPRLNADPSGFDM